jgi:hypothetical protein
MATTTTAETTMTTTTCLGATRAGVEAPAELAVVAGWVRAPEPPRPAAVMPAMVKKTNFESNFFVCSIVVIELGFLFKIKLITMLCRFTLATLTTAPPRRT